MKHALTDRGQFAAMAMQGMLSDPTDMTDEIRTIPSHENEVREACSRYAAGAVANYTDFGIYYTRPVFTAVQLETCAEAVARLAVEHADALIKELDKAKP
jgi:hypothetical protein